MYYKSYYNGRLLVNGLVEFRSARPIWLLDADPRTQEAAGRQASEAFLIVVGTIIVMALTRHSSWWWGMAAEAAMLAGVSWVIERPRRR